MSHGVQQHFVAYVILLYCVLTINVAGLEQKLDFESIQSSLAQNREKRQQLPIPVEQISQINAANDLNLVLGVSGNEVTNLQGGTANIGSQQELSQVFNNLIDAAAAQQAPRPQQLIRVSMNSGLKR